MNEIFGIKGVEIGNVYNFACEDMVSKPTVVELEQGGLLGGLADWAVNPSNWQKRYPTQHIEQKMQRHYTLRSFIALHFHRPGDCALSPAPYNW